MVRGGGVVVLVKLLEKPEDSARIEENVEITMEKMLGMIGNGIQSGIRMLFKLEVEMKEEKYQAWKL
jgi:hypothetical protein